MGESMAACAPATVRTLLDDAAERLCGASSSARLDAELLLGHVLGKNRAALWAWPDAQVPRAEVVRFQELTQRRASGEPLAYLVGRREFWSVDLMVTPATLIPRPETEHLVEAALALIPAGARWTVADLGTGSGAIAIALAKERPSCHILASDCSMDALLVARANAAYQGIENISLVCGDWLDPLPRGRFHVIVSNPPYVADADPRLSRGDLRFEPRTALDGGPRGLDALRHIIRRAPTHLLAGGWLILEHGACQADAVHRMLLDNGLHEVRLIHDLQGGPRVTTCQAACQFLPLVYHTRHGRGGRPTDQAP